MPDATLFYLFHFSLVGGLWSLESNSFFSYFTNCSPCVLTRREAYHLGRIHSLHPQKSKGKDIVRRATVAVIAKNASAADSPKVEYIVRDLSEIAPV